MPAWPLSRWTDFVANNLPVISAAFLNAVQDVIVGLCSGTVTLKALVIDGAGGSAATPLAGTLTLSAITSGATVPTTSGPAAQADRGSVAVSWIKFYGTGTIDRAHNVHAFSRTGAGVYVVTLPWALSHPLITHGLYASGGGWTCRVLDTVSGGKTVITVSTYDATATLADVDTVHLLVHGDN